MTEYCDLVTQGGITSGVIYPKLIARLATSYQFNSIGGTSAGAIAAGACAAAEYGRHHGNPHAFDEVARLPDLFSAKDTPDSHTKLFRLFQPDAAVRRHFAVLTQALSKDEDKSTDKKNKRAKDWQKSISNVLRSLLGMYIWLLRACLLLSSLLLWPLVLALLPGLGQVPTFVLAALLMLLSAACGCRDHPQPHPRPPMAGCGGGHRAGHRHDSATGVRAARHHPGAGRGRAGPDDPGLLAAGLGIGADHRAVRARTARLAWQPLRSVLPADTR